ncbi:isopeptide-forming domain-containing fimbrial protein [Ruminococcus sp.]|uniref:isopeptide-forming domain-containing fimbrial protein n=1 Tax=Ruminococcus sp. TaxID=41978 RepID=UPI0025CF5185|nr:isopeptide-forming domain-containing fimbrial protein [Ruminococcus sp.]
MKTNKKTLAILTAGLLAVTPMAATGFTAFAADYDITVNNETDGYTYNAYKIFAGTLSGTVLSNVTWATGFDGAQMLLDLKGDTLLGSDFATVTDAASIAAKLPDLSGNSEKLAQFAKLAYANKGTTASVASGGLSGGVYTIPATEAGYYLIEEASVPTGAITSRYLLKVAGPTDVTPKRPSPSLTKVISNPNPKDSGKANDVCIGDAVSYTLTSAVPDMTGYSKYFFVVNDDLAAGLTFNNDVAVTIGATTLTAGTHYVVQTDAADTDGHSFQIVFKDFYGNWKTHSGETITVTYSATLNENANRGTTGNVNTANLTYSNNPNVAAVGESPTNSDEPKKPEGGNPGDSFGTTPDQQTKTYTANIKLTKRDGASTTTPKAVLTGAKFQISGVSDKVVLINEEAFEEAASGTYYRLKNGTFALVSSSPAADDIDDSSKKYNKVTNVTSSTVKTNICKEAYVKADGTLEFGGLGAGTYTITEIKTPDGYNTVEPITIVIDDTNTVFSAPQWSATKDGAPIAVNEAASSAAVEFDVVNNVGTTLPSTGGIGTKLFYIIGSLLVAGSVVLLVTKKRMSVK